MPSTSQRTRCFNTSLSSPVTGGDQYLLPPPDYVENQFEYNRAHKNGNIESFHEQALDSWDYASRVVTLNKLPTGSFLDAGCRTGYVMEAMMSRFPQAVVVGVDIVPEFVEQASSIGDAKIADLHELPFETGAFDWIFCSQALEHCYDVPKAIRELYRVASCGLMLSLPLEIKRTYVGNPSHYFYTDHSFTWLAKLRSDAHEVIGAFRSSNKEFVVVLAKRGLCE